ncbi:putative Vacuolar amino acid transporter 1 [Glarea lozoyensis 74030]|uniref:Putative Vacuolar amino acid transporter 1 n=1 Tax=Glarea lozoyensis (strain ATCC 74030 / MF5533) TaxID=1104152 RepID=H0ECD6_GLAL7|nr:putative Vacuolar amino acid transporter 1 [Glarea lozoyensis 74030]
MFGDRVMNEVTGNILDSPGYPRTLSILLCIFIAIIPLTKVPLNARPIVSTIETLTGLGPETVSDTPVLTGMSGYTRGILRVLIRIFVILMFVLVAILFPAFDSIMAFMGNLWEGGKHPREVACVFFDHRFVGSRVRGNGH